MSRVFALSLVTSLLGLASGCAICCAPFDCDYPVMPGRWTRFNPSAGRVGSAFDEAGGPTGVEQASATEPTPAQPSQQNQSPPTPSRTAPSQTSVQPMPPQYYYGNQSRMYGQPQAQGRMMPAPRSVIPRDMGNTYLPSGE